MSPDQKRAIYTGASGLVLPVPNKSLYPPEFQNKSRLEYYASLFNSIEINSSFYKLPQAATVKKWAGLVPDHFRFTFKLWREITHNKNLEFREEDLAAFMERIEHVGHKKGCLLVQFPPSNGRANFLQLEKLLFTLAEINAESGWRIAIEFRNKSWYDDMIFEMVARHNGSVVVHDVPASRTPMPEEVDDFVYLRFHGPNGGYRGSYDDEFLSEYASYINSWEEEGKTVFAYFNNTMGNAVGNLMSLNDYVNEWL